MKHLVIAALALGLPSTALATDHLAGFEGRWQGAGTLVLEGEPAQAFRCRLRLRGIETGQSFFLGRCATAQAAVNFTIMLFAEANGGLRGENRAVGDSSLPDELHGTLSAQRFELRADGAVFSMTRAEGGLSFYVEGAGDQGRAQGQALLRSRD